MFRERAQMFRSAPVSNLVTLSTVVFVGLRLVGGPGLTDIRLSILTGVSAAILLADRALARRRGLALHGAIGWALVALVAVVTHHSLLAAHGLDLGWCQFAMACSLCVAAIATVAAGAMLVGPLLSHRSTQNAGAAIVIGICLAVDALLLLSLAATQPVGPARVPLMAVAAVGLALWGSTWAHVRRTAPGVGSSIGDPVIHLVGWGHMAALLVGYLTGFWASIPVASLASCGLLALASHARSDSPTQTATEVRRVHVVAVAASTVTLLTPGAAWMYLLGSEMAWPATAVTILCIGAIGGLLALLRLGRESDAEPTKRVPDPATEFCLHFQPIVRVSDGAMVGAEALLREITDDGVSSSAPTIVDHLGLDPAHDVVTDFVLTETFRQGASLLGTMADPDAFVTLNLTPHEVARPDIIDRVQRALDATGCEPTGFGIELTEQATVDFTDHKLADRLTVLQNLGFLIALDDFGTGHSNLASLSEFEFDLIKLDRSLLRAAGTSRGDRVLRKTVELASESGARVVLEGIEDDAHHDILRRHRPDFAQGYGFAHPEPALDVLYALDAANVTSLD